jgi:hypothetical protein
MLGYGWNERIKSERLRFRDYNLFETRKTMSSRRPKLIEVTSLVAVTQAAVGCGVGLLLASRFKATARKVTGWIMVSLGVASVTPLVVGYFTRTANRPGSARAMRRRLDSIRQDSGFSENADVF